MTITSRSEPPRCSNKGIIYKTLPRARLQLNYAQEPEEPISFPRPPRPPGTAAPLSGPSQPHTVGVWLWAGPCSRAQSQHTPTGTSLAQAVGEESARLCRGSPRTFGLLVWGAAHLPVMLFLKSQYEHWVLLNITPPPQAAHWSFQPPLALSHTELSQRSVKFKASSNYTDLSETFLKDETSRCWQ